MEAVMSSIGLSHRSSGRRRPWTSLLEDRFTNADVVMLVCALLMTGFVGVLSAAAHLH